MDQQKIQTFQRKFLEFQQNLIEIAASENNEIQVTINGKVEIIELKIIAMMPTNELETILQQTINRAIVQVSLKIQQAMQLFSQSNT